MFERSFLQLLGVFVLVSLLNGCGNDPVQVPDNPPDVGAGHDHSHASTGPHGGGLIELGGGQYHGELVHDEKTGSVTVYLLDESTKNATPIEAAEVTINLTHDGQPEQFKLAASAAEGDPAGKSSRFVSQEAALGKELDHAHGTAQLVVTINGKQYRGDVAHDHGHDHDH